MAEVAKKKIVFICVENSNRSQLAEGFARQLAGERIAVYSAGSRPAAEIHPLARQILAERGYAVTQQRPKSLAELPPGPFDVVVSMGCGDAGCPTLAAHQREEWNLPDPRHLSEGEYRAVALLIEQKVRELLARLGVL